MNGPESRSRERSPLLFLPFRLLDTPVLRRLDAPLGILSGFQTDQLTRHLQSSKTNASNKRQMSSDRLILISFCCRRCGITMHVRASVRPSRQEFIMSSFALHSGNLSTAGWEDSKLRSYPNIKHKRRGQNP